MGWCIYSNSVLCCTVFKGVVSTFLAHTSFFASFAAYGNVRVSGIGRTSTRIYIYVKLVPVYIYYVASVKRYILHVYTWWHFTAVGTMEAVFLALVVLWP